MPEEYYVLKFLEATIKPIAEKMSKRILEKVKRSLMKGPSMAEEHFANCWDDICTQMQTGDFSYFWTDDYAGTGGYVSWMKDEIRIEIEELSNKEKDILWILTEEYADWLCRASEDKNVNSYEYDGYKETDIVKYLFQELLSIAEKHSNSLIEKYIETYY